MPYVLIHKHERRIFSCTLMNIYQLPYFGAKYWDTEEEAKEEALEWLESHGETDPDAWDLLQVEENQLKIFNVKLANNPARAVRLDEDNRAIGYSV